MLALHAQRRFQRRLLMDGVLWLLAAALGYFLVKPSAGVRMLPLSAQTHLEQFPIQQFSDSFPIFGFIIALSLLCVWAFRCSRHGAAFICTAWMLGGIGLEYAHRSDVSSWLLPRLPWFFHTLWPLDYIDHYLGRGGFDSNNVVAAVLAGIIGYVMVLNSIPNRVRV